MSDMPIGFWAGWIAVITATSFIGLGWLVYSIYFSSDSHSDVEGDPVWDETLREGSNPAPMWWFWLILSLMVFSVVYLLLYPGLGSYAGALRWTQGGHLQSSLVDYQNEFGGTRSLIAEGNLATLAADESLVASAQRVFDRNCAACHGYDAEGQANLFPNLGDSDWQWGGTPEQIEHSIRLGRKAAMVPWAAILGDDGVTQMVDLVQKLGDGSVDAHPAKQQYTQFCAACHGIDGTGNVVLGAPNLTDDIWLYGNSEAAIRETIEKGRQGEMPAFGDRLDDTQIRLLVMLLGRDSD